ncbi:hypothetical protein CQP30_19815 [Yersinia pestis]|uniref:Membrane protein n=8 Tax=Yersinia pseudotuberculosis complex TaxID=1649845 RepID=A0AAX2I407_YERPE|nr:MULTISPECIES: hypothetical protein [Yersinia pseudotuberculosis complex]EFA48896.1 conserved hypothetical protein [Yersinia pestis KIM D27]ERP71276.1 membrane protein [Yersinia pestis S3]ERP71929.1 membrane protein [Yersinia pestis 24H]CQD50877.1 membrane protein [Yersinia intermedia]AAS61128.1 putative membrane protein [Yersinia pestis biovar Microtus str. 91001]
MDHINNAKRVLDENAKVLYGIFGVISCSGYFPPLPFLNEFFMAGSDPCDQDERMDSWCPFTLTSSEYEEVKAWWLVSRPGTVESALGSECWDDWIQEILEL